MSSVASSSSVVASVSTFVSRQGRALSQTLGSLARRIGELIHRVWKWVCHWCMALWSPATTKLSREEKEFIDRFDSRSYGDPAQVDAEFCRVAADFGVHAFTATAKTLRNDHAETVVKWEERINTLPETLQPFINSAIQLVEGAVNLSKNAEPFSQQVKELFRASQEGEGEIDPTLPEECRQYILSKSNDLLVTEDQLEEYIHRAVEFLLPGAAPASTPPLPAEVGGENYQKVLVKGATFLIQRQLTKIVEKCVELANRETTPSETLIAEGNANVNHILGHLLGRFCGRLRGSNFPGLYDELQRTLYSQTQMIFRGTYARDNAKSYIDQMRSDSAMGAFNPSQQEALAIFEENLNYLREEGKEEDYLRATLLMTAGAADHCQPIIKEMILENVPVSLRPQDSEESAVYPSLEELEREAVVEFVEDVLALLFPAEERDADADIVEDLWKAWEWSPELKEHLDYAKRWLGHFKDIITSYQPPEILEGPLAEIYSDPESSFERLETQYLDSMKKWLRGHLVKVIADVAENLRDKYLSFKGLQEFSAEIILPTVNSLFLSKFIAHVATGPNCRDIHVLAQQLFAWRQIDPARAERRREEYRQALESHVLEQLDRTLMIYEEHPSLSVLIARSYDAYEATVSSNLGGERQEEASRMLERLAYFEQREEEMPQEELAPFLVRLRLLERELLGEQLRVYIREFLENLEDLLNNYAARPGSQPLDISRIEALLRRYYRYPPDPSADTSNLDALLSTLLFDFGKFGGSFVRQLYKFFSADSTTEVVSSISADIRSSPDYLMHTIARKVDKKFGAPEKVDRLLYGASPFSPELQETLQRTTEQRFRWQVRQTASLTYDTFMMRCNALSRRIFHLPYFFGSDEHKVERVINDAFDNLFGERLLNLNMALQVGRVSAEWLKDYDHMTNRQVIE